MRSVKKIVMISMHFGRTVGSFLHFAIELACFQGQCLHDDFKELVNKLEIYFDHVAGKGFKFVCEKF